MVYREGHPEVSLIHARLQPAFWFPIVTASLPSGCEVGCGVVCRGVLWCVVDVSCCDVVVLCPMACPVRLRP